MVNAVSDSHLPPEQWRPLFDKAGIEFGYRPLAARAGLTHTRVHRLIRGGGTTDDAIQRVADALGVKASKVRELRNEPAVEPRPFTLPDDAGRLNHNEREVIRSVVRALLDARDGRYVMEDAPEPPAPPEGDEGQEGGPPSGDGPKPWTPPPDWIWPTDDDPGMGDSEDAQDA